MASFMSPRKRLKKTKNTSKGRQASRREESYTHGPLGVAVQAVQLRYGTHDGVRDGKLRLGHGAPAVDDLHPAITHALEPRMEGSCPMAFGAAERQLVVHRDPGHQYRRHP